LEALVDKGTGQFLPPFLSFSPRSSFPHPEPPAIQKLEKNEEEYFARWLNEIYKTYPRERLNFFEHNLEV